MKLPEGWTPEYALWWAVQEINDLTLSVAELKHKVGSLEIEVTRLEAEKANRAGRKKAKVD